MGAITLASHSDASTVIVAPKNSLEEGWGDNWRTL